MIMHDIGELQKEYVAGPRLVDVESGCDEEDEEDYSADEGSVFEDSCTQIHWKCL